METTYFGEQQWRLTLGLFSQLFCLPWCRIPCEKYGVHVRQHFFQAANKKDFVGGGTN
jgi:hypothetical protein